MKKYAYYLPQYHEIPENNKWWGEGFTEWTNVKKAKALFPGHVQPKHPLNSNYYRLDNAKVLKWQADIAHQYGIDGMIFYHYFFCGKKLLEKPAELLLKNADIKMNYFFCWANHSWYRSWDGTKKLLLEQKYGEEADWEEHFQYLLPFFQDYRYEKKNNMPLFMIFKSDFEQKNAYLEFLDKRCRDYGFKGIYAIEIIEQHRPKICKKTINNRSLVTKAMHFREPSASLNFLRSRFSYVPSRIKNKIGKFSRKFGVHYIEKYNGNTLYKKLIKTKIVKDVIPGICFEWDNTPRHDYRGYVITPPSKEVFMRYMNTIKESEYVFINAWNEWCEGMMLEPTEENGYKYLEWIKEWSKKYENKYI